MLYDITWWTSLHLSRFYFHFFIQGLQELDLRANELRDEGTQYLADVLRDNTVNLSIYVSCSFSFVLQRHSPNSPLTTMKSVAKERNVWLTCCEITRWTSFFLHLPHFLLQFLIQGLTELQLASNKIGVKGAQHLGDVLRYNRVSFYFSSFSSLLSSHFHTDTHVTIPSLQWNRRQRSPTSGCWFKK
jgi:Ran GTPase-activating protein (RanGAP) involved in mRNA processing and transport